MFGMLLQIKFQVLNKIRRTFMKKLKMLSFLILSIPLIASCSSGSAKKQHVHSYDFDNGKWFWSETETGYSASLTVFCETCDENTKGHRLELEATVTKTINDPTCTVQGATVYTASVTYEGKSYSDKKEFPIDALGHNYISLSVEGDYPKTYQAFDTFDDSNLIVKSVCDICGDEIVIPRGDYYVVYSTFGADYLSAGDTSVTISYQGTKKVLDGLTVTPITIKAPAGDASSFTYDGEEKVYAVQESEYYTISGNKATDAGEYDATISLKDKKNYVWDNGNNNDIVYHFTINQAANEISGLLDHYDTTCGTKPDFSGVTSTANDVEFHYYRDSVMTDEVLESEISEGTYYIKAISGGANYVQVVKTTTLTVSHSFDCEVAHDEYLKTAATEYENAVYYKSCVCGAASTTDTFIAEGTKLPTLLADTSYEPSEAVEETAPEGFTKVSKGTISYEGDLQSKEFLKNIDVTGFSTIYFAFKTENRRFCDKNWENPIPLNEWHYVTITRNQNGTLTSVIKNAKGIALITYSDATSFRNALPYYNWDGDQPFMVWYSTEVLGIRHDAVGTMVAPSSVASYESLSESAPLGYFYVTKGTVTYSDSNQGQTFLTNLDISEYSSVYFAFKTANRRFCNSAWESPLTIGVWYFVTITNNGDGTYTSVIKDGDGNTKFGYENKNSFKESLLYYNWDGSEPNAVWYSTEVRGTAK